MINVLGIGLDYLMLQKEKVRGDVRDRQLEYAKYLESLTLIVYSPRHLGLKKERWADNLEIYPTNSISKATFLFDAIKIGKEICQQRKIDVITTEDPFTTGFVGYRLKKRFNIPLNIQMHIDFYDNSYWIKDEKINRVFNTMGKWLIKKADTLRMGTSREREKLIKEGISDSNLFVIPVDSKPEKFEEVSGDRIRKKYCHDKFNKIILFAGRFTRQKDIPTLLKAFALVAKKSPKTLLLLVGSGKEEADLKSMVGEFKLNGNVVFPGAIPHHLIPEYLSACDVFVISSIFEGTCIALAEAAMSGKPVISTNIAGADDLIVDGKTGFIVKQKDYKEMAGKILFLLNNPDKAEIMGLKAKEYVQKQFIGNQDITGAINLWKRTAKLRNKK